MAIPENDPSLGSKPAPGELRLVQAFVNTLEPDVDAEVFVSPAALHDWLVFAELLPAGSPDLDDADVVRARALREALRSLLLANAGEDLDPAAAALVEGEAERVPLRLCLTAEGRPSLGCAGGGLDGAVSRLLAVIAVAGVDGTWRRLKACREHTCEWAFYDSSRNGSGAWCTMAVCGNRTKARRFRERHSAAAAAAS